VDDKKLAGLSGSGYLAQQLRSRYHLDTRAAQLGQTRFVTFDAGAAKLPRGELLAGAA
jgi:DNA-binding IclR family transcriptional regulator